MLKILTALVISLACVNAQAQEHAVESHSHSWEISGGANAQYNHTSSNNFGTHNWSLAGQGAYVLNQNWEVAASLDILFNSGTINTTATHTILAGLVYNVSADTINSIFVEALAGIRINDTGATGGPNYTQFVYQAGAGKRFGITSTVAWKPEFIYTGVAAKGGTPSAAGTSGFAVVPVQFSILL